MYQCIGKFGKGLFGRKKTTGCGEKYHYDDYGCLNCGGYLIPESMVTQVHLDNIDPKKKGVNNEK